MRTERKATNGHGSVSPRKDGRWSVSYFDLNGNRHQSTVRSEEDGLRMLREALVKRDKGVPAPSGSEKLAAYLEEWLAIVAPTLKSSSAQRYRLAVQNHVIPILGEAPLARLGPKDIQALHSHLLANGLSAATVAHVHDILNKAMADAERWERIGRNPVRLVSPPRKAAHEMATFTQAELQRLIAVARRKPLGALFVLLATTGMRIGEALATKWPAVDLERATLQVTVTLSRDGRRYAVTEPKTSGSRRLVLLPAVAVESLRLHRARQAEQRLRFGIAYEDRGFVFADELGHTLHPGGRPWREWKTILSEAGLDQRRLHDLRHTYITIQMEQGTPVKFVAGQVGHANPNLTLNRYAHVTPIGLEQVREAMDRALSR